MAEGKKSFILYVNYWDFLQELNTEQLGQITRIMFEYVNDLNPEAPTDPMCKMAWSVIRSALKEDLIKWQECREQRSEAGKKHKGNQYTRNGTNGTSVPKMEQMERNGTNGTVNVNVNDNVNVNVNDNVNDNVNVNVNDNDDKKDKDKKDKIENYVFIHPFSQWLFDKGCLTTSDKKDLESFNQMFSNLCDKYSKQRELLERVVAYVGYRLSNNYYRITDKVAYTKRAIESNMLIVDKKCWWDEISDDEWKHFESNYGVTTNG